MTSSEPAPRTSCFGAAADAGGEGRPEGVGPWIGIAVEGHAREALDEPRVRFLGEGPGALVCVQLHRSGLGRHRVGAQGRHRLRHDLGQRQSAHREAP